MMRKMIPNQMIYGFLLIIVFSQPALSQTGFRMALRGGPQISGFTGGDFFSTFPRRIAVHSKQRVGYQFGFDFEYLFSEHFGLASGLIFSQQGQLYDLELGPIWGNGLFEARLMYARIPLSALFRFYSNGPLNLFLKGGFYTAFLTDVDDNYQDVIPEEIGLPRPDKRYAGPDFGWQAGIGAEIGLSPMLHLRIAADFHHGLRRVFSFEPWGYLAGAAEAKNTILSLSIGLVYSHGRCCGPSVPL